jgi:hypothetical protein
VKPGKLEVLGIDDTFCAAHGGQQLAFWNEHHDERGFASLLSLRSIRRSDRLRMTVVRAIANGHAAAPRAGDRLAGWAGRVRTSESVREPARADSGHVEA